MYGKMRKNLGFSLMPIAFLFLFEPTYALIDPLPDFIGYLILCIAIINLADICTGIRDSFTGFRKAALISVSRFTVIYLVNEYFAQYEQSMGILLFSFVFSFFEIIVVMPAYKSFFEGILSLGLVCDGEAMYHHKRRGSPNLVERTHRITIIFILSKCIICLLPEFTSLISSSSYEFVSLLRTFAFILVLPVSILWLIKILLFCHKIKEDTAFISNLSDKYIDKVNSNPNFYIFRVLNTCVCSLSVAVALSVDLYIENINVLPDIFSYCIILICACFFLKNHTTKWRLAAIASALGTVASATVYFLTKDFFSQYTVDAVKKEIGAYCSYYSMVLMYMIEAVIFIVTLTSVILSLLDIYKNHTSISCDNNGREYKQLCRQFKTGAIIASCLGLLTCIGCVYYVLALPLYSKGWFFYYSTVISTTLSLIFVGVTCYFIGWVRGCIREHYRKYLI